MRGRGLLFSDQQLMANEKAAAAVTDYSYDDGTIFRRQFAHAMSKLSNIGVLTESTSVMSTATVATGANAAQASMVAPFNGLKFAASFPVTRKQNIDITSIASNGGKHGFVYREHRKSPGYYDGRYWTMWKLPMFGCTDATQVLNEVQEAKKAYPQAWVRIIGFDNVRQVQCISFIAYKPEGY
ncbi:Ribulose bisphosphate carboxylase small chain, chloroplastic [Capsicum annuum]|nr:Ribulose bisphosphate carboxylase small chain, chloroplastic [Capsicum annuum]